MPLTVEQFTQRLTSSGVMSDDELRDWFMAMPIEKRPLDCEALARELVKQKKLTRFQAEQIYAGKEKSLTLGNYVILDKLGQGGMGMVLKARHQRMGRVVALKVMSPAAVKSKDAVKRFHREVQTAAKLTHPNIVTAFDADEAKGTHFLVMEYVEGDDLSQLVKKHGALSVEQTIECMLQAARGLVHAHKEGVIHRDIKPANLLLDKNGTVKILDMGLARLETGLSDAGGVEGAGLTQTGTIMGTVDYMSPEQAEDTRHADARSDIYSLGCSLYYLLVGHAVYGGETMMKKLLAHRDAPIPSLRSPVAPRQEFRSSVDGGSPQEHQTFAARSESESRSDSATWNALNSVFRKMLAKKPSDRQQSMLEVVADLERCRAGEGVTINTAAVSGEAASGYELQKFLRQISGEEGSQLTAATSTGARGTSALPAGEIAETILTTTDGAGTDPQTEMTLQLERSKRASGMKRQTRNALLAVAGVVVLLLGSWWAFGTPKGTVRIEITDDEIAVELGESGRTLRGNVEEAIKLPVGEHVLHVRVGDVKLDTPEITVAKGESIAIKVERVGNRVRVMRDGEFLVAKELPRLKASGGASGIAKSSGSEQQSDAVQNFALQFDGKSSYVEIPTLKRNDPGPFTIEARVRFAPTTARNAVSIVSIDGTAACQIQAGTHRLIGGLERTKNGSRMTDGALPTPDVWQHVAFVLDSRDAIVFIDGQEVRRSARVAAAEVGSYPDGAHGTLFGAQPLRGKNHYHFGGELDEVRISKTARYQKSFTPSQERFTPDKDTLALYHFDEGQGSVLKDSSGNKHHGKIVGAKWVKASGSPIPPPASSYALQFNGNDSLVEIPSLRYDGPHPVTIESWVRLDKQIDKEKVQGIAGWGGVFQMFFFPNRLTAYGYHPDGKTYRNGMKSFKLDEKPQFFHVASVWDGKQIRSYVDGVVGAANDLSEIRNAAKIPGLAPDNLALGGVKAITAGDLKFYDHFDGFLREVRISKTARYTKDFTPQKRFEPDADTLALYHFDEGSGEVLKDSSGNKHHGKIVGAKWVKVGGTPILPNERFALEFDDSPDRGVVLPLRYDGKHPFTAEAWVSVARFVSGDPHQNVIADASASGGFHLGILDSGPFWKCPVYGNLGVATLQPPEKIIPNRTTHVALTIETGTARFFVDGKLKQTEALPGNYKPSGGSIYLARNPGGTPLSGKLFEVRLSKTNRYVNDFAPQARFEPDADTLGLYHFDEGSGDVLKDSSGNNHHGKIVGAKWVKVSDSASEQSDPERAVAEWIIKGGGQVVVLTGANAVVISKLAELPVPPFTIRDATFHNLPDFTAEDARRLTGLRDLERITFRSTTVRAEAVQTLAGCRRLFVLLLDQGSTTEAALLEIVNLPRLRNISLLNVPVPEEFFARVGQLNRLLTLSIISSKPIIKEALNRLAAAPPPKLQTLGLGGLQGVTDGLAAVARLPHLHTFTSGGNDFDDAAIAELGQSSSLSAIGLSDCRVTQAGTTALQKTLANCRILVPKAEQNPSLYGPAYRETIRQLIARGLSVEVTTNTLGRMAWITGDEPFPAGDVVCAEAVASWTISISPEIADLKRLAQLSDLRTFYLAPLPPNGLRELLPLKNLTELNSAPSRLSDDEIALLPSLKKLHRIELTVGSDKQLETIAQLPHLSWLGISLGSKITDNGLKVLESAHVLSRVDLHDVSQAAAQALANARPDVDVYWKNKLLPAIDPEREVAEWALSVGGTVTVLGGTNTANVEPEIKEAAKLPTGAFRLTKLTVPQSVTSGTEKLALFGQSTKLRELDLGGIPLTDDGLKALAPLKQLTHFSSGAPDPKLTDDGFGVFASFPKLYFLALPNFIPSSQQADAIAKLTQLRILQIFVSSPETLRKIFTLPNLDQILLFGPGVTDEVFALVSARPAIRRLFIGGRSTVTDRGFGEAKRMATLQSFELDRVPDITDVGIGHLVAMPKLTKILLAGLPVTDAALAHLAKMEQLQSIRLVKLPISDAGLLQLAPLKNLESLTLNQLNVTAAGVAALQEALPNCKIEWDSPKTADRFTNTLGMEFVRVPKGKSWLGGGGGKPGTQPVEFKEDFYLGKFEVTQEEWQKVMGTNPSSFSRRGSYKDRVKDISDADLKQFPVTGVTWNDCQEFVARLNATTKEDGWVYRLPKEVEWEYACRGGPLADPSESAFDFYLATPTNELLPGQASLNRGNDPAYPNKVGSYPANRLGLHDMHGNVCEWCDDEVPLDPKAPEQGLGRMTRGHGWINDRRYHGQAAQRYARPASTRDENHGLRVARVRTTTQTATAWQPLFNDKGLSGWTKGNTGSADIVIEDGQPTLRLKEPVTLSSLPIGDYQLRFEYKPSSGQYGGGVHLMGLPNSSLALGLGDLKTPNIMGHACRFHAAEIQAGQFVRIGEPVPEKTLTRLPNVSLNPTTPWQQFEVSRLGDSFVFRINGKPAGAFTNVRWLRDGNEEIPAQRAPIVFWAFGGPGQFRNVEIREINALPPEILEQAAWQPLFNGKDLTGWTKTNPAVNTGRGEVVNDDGQPALRLTKPFGLGTNSEFGSYHLRYQTKADAGAGGVHHVFRKGVGFSLVCLVDGQSVTPQLSCFGGATFQKAIWRAGQFVAEGERLNAPTKLAFPPVPAAIGWQTVEILRLDDSFLYLVNGRLAGAITNLRIVRNNESERLGTTPLEFFVGSIGPASFRNIELREITALPPELLQNLTGESK